MRTSLAWRPCSTAADLGVAARRQPAACFPAGFRWRLMGAQPSLPLTASVARGDACRLLTKAATERHVDVAALVKARLTAEWREVLARPENLPPS
jgi:hypothetical protein